MSHSIAIEQPQAPVADAGRDGWSARRRLACMVVLSMVSWLVILAPAMIWG